MAREAQPNHRMYRVFLTNHLMNLGELLRRAGKLDEAARLASESAALWPRQPQQLVQAALLLSACSESTGKADTPDLKARRDHFAQSAVQILTQAFDAGFREASFYRTSPQLAAIRGREDFQALLRRLDKAVGETAK